MRKLTKVGMASLLTIALAGGTTAAFASTDAPQKAHGVTREHKAMERTHDTAKDRSVDRSAKDTSKGSWDQASKDGSKSPDKPSPDPSKG
jgi:hypothetical protein